MRDFVAYAQFDWLWERFRPDTPFGRDVRDRREFLADARALEALWDRTDAILQWLEDWRDQRPRLDRVTHHLKRLPRFPDQPRNAYDEVELFQVKKFLHNYRSLMQLLPEGVRQVFGLAWHSPELEKELDRGHQSPESFYVADEYSDELGSVRAEVRWVDEALALSRDRRARQIKERFGLEFGFRDFLVVPRNSLGDPMQAADLLLVEPHDDRTLVVRPRPEGEELTLNERRLRLLDRERACEDEILERLSAKVCAELPRLLEYRRAVEAFDLAFARARLALEHGMTRPTLGEGPLEIVAGRFLPCLEQCRVLGTDYQPLEARFDTSATVLSGSNMGGKTVVLKTLAFLQLCVQAGLFAPAKRFATRLFERFHYVGEGADREEARGLSGFGFEIQQFKAAWNDFGHATLALFDEFARTTNSQEAEALISAALEDMVGRPALVALFSTHFRGVRRVPGVRFLRMQGLDRRSLDLQSAAGSELEARIRLIDRHMEYRLVPDDGARHSSDAIAVAALLGLDPSLAERARRLVS